MKRRFQAATVLVATLVLAAGSLDTANAQERFYALGFEFGNAINFGASATVGTDRMAFTMGLGEGMTRTGYEMSDYLFVSGSIFAASLGDLHIYPSATLALHADCQEVGIPDGECVRMQYFDGQFHGGRIDKRLDTALGLDLFLMGNRNGLSLSPKIYASGGFTIAFGFIWRR